MKKLTLIVMALSLLGLLAASCSSSEGTDAGKTGTDTTKTSTDK